MEKENFGFIPGKHVPYHQRQEELEPYITFTNGHRKGLTAYFLSLILDSSENQEEILELLRSNDGVSDSKGIKEIIKLFEDKKISPNAPWFKKLKEKIFTLKIFIASTDHEMGIK